MYEQARCETAVIAEEQTAFAVADAHIDVLTAMEEQERTFDGDPGRGHVNLERLKAGGVTLACLACYIAPRFRHQGPHRALQLIDLFYRVLAGHEEDLVQVTGAASLAALADGGRIGVLLTVEGGEALGGDLGMLRMLHRLGVRMLGLTWNGRNELADGVGERETGGGLTRLGREAVGEMDRLGMAVDVSHLSEAGFWDVISLAQRPPLASHANCAALCAHPRNLDDRQIRALSEKGGIVCLTFCPSFVDPEHATRERLIDHIVHAASLAGAQAVGLGSDFDGIEDTIPGLENPSCFPGLAGALLKRGFTPGEVRGIMGENLVRYLRRVLP